MSAPLNPADIAREAFRRLATRRMLPTPDAYRNIYYEVAGTDPRPEADIMLERFVKQIAAARRDALPAQAAISEAISEQDWRSCEQHLQQLAHLLQPSHLPVVTAVRGNPALPVKPFAVGDAEATLRDLLVRLLGETVASLLQDAPGLASEAASIAETIRKSPAGALPANGSSRIKQLDYRIELRNGDMAYQQALLLDLLRLLLENVNELVEDDRWLVGQIANIQEILAGPLDAITLKEALRNLKEIIFKQGVLKHSLREAKTAFKSMMLTFIDRAGTLADTTDDYHRKMDGLAQKISQTDSINALNTLLDEVMQETRAIQSEAMLSRDAMVMARNNAQRTEARIQSLEQQLVQMSELAHEDHLTGSLNRRGMEDLLDREMARVDRSGGSLCIALLDLDDFKRINDTHGHATGDRVLVHLVKVVKETLRAMDVIARFGGEEFLIVLPDTPLDAATATITRVQRELTKQIFLRNDERLLITFSAGVAIRAPLEDKPAFIKRADQALYLAKAAGKNRVAVAP
jgi:diguanylate cyclase